MTGALDDRDTMTSPAARLGSRARVRLLRVLPVAGARPTTIALDREPVEIGRPGHARSVAVTDPEVSRLHARVVRDGDGWAVVDHGSHNGTFVGGVRVERAALHDGALIRVGKTLIVYVEGELSPAGEPEPPPGTALAGTSLATLQLHGEIGLVAPHPVAVLVLGETGAGKEVIAHEIHRRSGRGGAFVAVNCAAISPLLAESELFGHVPGAFTGATRAAEGLFAAADGGTLFLDEVGELPAELQPKLLRALASAEVRAVGATAARRVDVRIVAATLRDLAGAGEDGFRADLLNRLSGWQIRVPPLRARRDDIIAIAAGYLARRQAPALSADAAEALVLHDWPGNVRELERVLAAALIRATGAAPRAELGVEHLPGELAARLGPRLGPELGLAPAELAPAQAVPLAIAAPPDLVPTGDELAAALTRYDGNIARVAEHFHKDRHQIYRWARRHGIDLDRFRPDTPRDRPA
jgi:transcriptional regulator with GAF, ATPase, and Fis domain